ncbi:UNVERIFIED_CONTAM: Raucaffricine-O-beta-D-glucosidase [Sesamum calycinum]|uniref:Raucaffricine-O-beta-D-glucosidase n=1 Tax=Sesamum calycinum TaxID=2727403 RepID=A0AAW2NGE5_9LAMI
MQSKKGTVNSTQKGNLQDNSGIGRGDFPNGFIFGTGTSAYQVEGAAAKGGRGISVWDDFALRTPNMIADGSNGNVACDMYHKYKEDIKLMKQMGFDSYRFSISWPRILPGGRTFAGINKEGIDYYNDVINTVIANGMTPFVTLFHWDLPNCLQLEYGGMLSDQVVNDFIEFANLCFEEFGDRVKFWTTLNEPYTYTVHGYSSGDDFVVDNSKIVQSSSQTAKDPYTVARNLLLCHSAAVQLYRTNFQMYQNGQIGIVLISNYHYPFDSTSQNDKDAVERALDFMLGWFLEPVIYGQFPASMLQYAKGNIVPFSDEEQQGLAGSVDWVGLNYYTSDFVAYEKDPPGVGYPADQHCLYSFYDVKGNTIGLPTALSWLWMVPNGLYDHLQYLQNKYKQDMPPLYVTENGVADNNDHALTAKQACVDTTRVQYYQDHLAYLLKAINELGFDVRGYFAWSYCDNFEWSSGYTSRFGIIYTDYVNNLTRHMKNSALWFTKFLRSSVTKPPTLEKRQIEKDSERGSKKRRTT